MITAWIFQHMCPQQEINLLPYIIWDSIGNYYWPLNIIRIDLYSIETEVNRKDLNINNSLKI